MTLSFLEIDRRWPGAGVLWDRDVAGEGWDPVFVERDGVLWAVETWEETDGIRYCALVNRRPGCKCRLWEPTLREWWTHARWERLRRSLDDHRRMFENNSYVRDSPYWGVDRTSYPHVWSETWLDESRNYTSDRIWSVMYAMRSVPMNPTNYRRLAERLREPPRPTLRKTLAALLNAPASTAGTR